MPYGREDRITARSDRSPYLLHPGRLGPTSSRLRLLGAVAGLGSRVRPCGLLTVTRRAGPPPSATRPGSRSARSVGCSASARTVGLGRLRVEGGGGRDPPLALVKSVVARDAAAKANVQRLWRRDSQFGERTYDLRRIITPSRVVVGRREFPGHPFPATGFQGYDAPEQEREGSACRPPVRRRSSRRHERISVWISVEQRGVLAEVGGLDIALFGRFLPEHRVHEAGVSQPS